MKRYVKVTVTEQWLYHIDGTKSDEEAVEIAKQRAEANSPLDLTGHVRLVPKAEIADGASL